MNTIWKVYKFEPGLKCGTDSPAGCYHNKKLSLSFRTSYKNTLQTHTVPGSWGKMAAVSSYHYSAPWWRLKEVPDRFTLMTLPVNTRLRDYLTVQQPIKIPAGWRYWYGISPSMAKSKPQYFACFGVLRVYVFYVTILYRKPHNYLILFC